MACPSLPPGSAACPSSSRTASPACCFEPGNVDDLTDKIRLLWANPDLCRRMGEAGRNKAKREFGEETYYNRLMSIYDRAIEIHGRHAPPRRKSTITRQTAEDEDERPAPQSAIAQ